MSVHPTYFDLAMPLNVGALIYEYPVTLPPPPDCLHPTLSGPTRTVVIIDILLTTRAAMHTTIAAAADWQFGASLSEANCKLVSFYGGRAPFCAGPVRPNMLNMPKSASVLSVVILALY